MKYDNDTDGCDTTTEKSNSCEKGDADVWQNHTDSMYKLTEARHTAHVWEVWRLASIYASAKLWVACHCAGLTRCKKKNARQSCGLLVSVLD